MCKFRFEVSARVSFYKININWRITEYLIVIRCEVKAAVQGMPDGRLPDWRSSRLDSDNVYTPCTGLRTRDGGNIQDNCQIHFYLNNYNQTYDRILSFMEWKIWFYDHMIEYILRLGHRPVQLVSGKRHLLPPVNWRSNQIANLVLA